MPEQVTFPNAPEAYETEDDGRVELVFRECHRGGGSTMNVAVSGGW